MLDGLECDVGGEQEELRATRFCARCSALCESSRWPVNLQMITRLATPSIAESIPKPISAIEPAMTPATMAIAPSAPIQTRLSHDSARARRAALSQSAPGADGARGTVAPPWDAG